MEIRGGVTTRKVKAICVGQNIQDQIVRNEQRRRIIDELKSLEKEFNRIINGNLWVRIENKSLYYIDGNYKLLIEDTTRANGCVNNPQDYFCGYNGRLLNRQEARELFYENGGNPLVNDNIIKYSNQNYSYIYFNDIDGKGECTLRIRDGKLFTEEDGYHKGLRILVYSLQRELSRFELFIKEDLIPEGLCIDKVMLLHRISKIYKEIYSVDLSNKRGSFYDDFVDVILACDYPELGSMVLERKAVQEYITGHREMFFDQIRESFMEEYLNCDYRRAGIAPYSFEIMEAEGRGHWDLWEVKRGEDEGKISIKEKPLIARNPLADIQEGGIVSIDFGTKTTVVMYLDDTGNIRPMRVGNGKYGEVERQEDYENPTVMEFRCIENFVKRYRERKGRPETLWEDLVVSHNAAQQLKSENDSSRFYCFFSDLKQWCKDRKRIARIKDNQGYWKELPAFLDIKEEDINPVEFYAYYLGLYINNMRQKIHLKYMLSFPETYEKAVRDKITSSFRNGILKSLPEAVLKDKDCMNMLDIRQWSSEPAAYAICALTEYGFQPKGDEKVFYGIFDFGGGTTDFDFGVWQASGESRYDYEINHFGEGGDQYLGGENLLEMMAFHVFRRNWEELLKNGIPFTRPHDSEDFLGSEAIVCDSHEARLNMRQLMEKLRGLWQNDNQEDIQAIEEGEIRLMLFNKQRKLWPNYSLKVDKEELLALLKNRIEKGVRNFFAAMTQTFVNDELRDVEKIHIFLAGNSSKSSIVTELFEKHCQEWTEKIRERFSEEILGVELQPFFEIFPSLGTPEAIEKQSKRGVNLNRSDRFVNPTGKTGVAYGLLLGRPGSRIRIIHKTRSDQDIKFGYYVGENTEEGFRVVVGRDGVYNQWVYFMDAQETDFEFCYTNLAEDAMSKSYVAGMPRKQCRIIHENADKTVGIYIRITGPSTVEYAVGTEEGIKQEKYMEVPRKVELL